MNKKLWIILLVIMVLAAGIAVIYKTNPSVFKGSVSLEMSGKAPAINPNKGKGFGFIEGNEAPAINPNKGKGFGFIEGNEAPAIPQ